MSCLLRSCESLVPQMRHFWVPFSLLTFHSNEEPVTHWSGYPCQESRNVKWLQCFVNKISTAQTTVVPHDDHILCSLICYVIKYHLWFTIAIPIILYFFIDNNHTLQPCGTVSHIITVEGPAGHIDASDPVWLWRPDGICSRQLKTKWFHRTFWSSDISDM